MDASEALKLARELCDRFDRVEDEHAEANIGNQLVDVVRGLDDWLSRGGYPPADWAPASGPTVPVADVVAYINRRHAEGRVALADDSVAPQLKPYYRGQLDELATLAIWVTEPVDVRTDRAAQQSPDPTKADAAALDAIADILRRPRWTPDSDMEGIAELVAKTGRDLDGKGEAP